MRISPLEDAVGGFEKKHAGAKATAPEFAAVHAVSGEV